MKTIILGSLLTLMAAVMVCTAEETKTLKVGDTAPKVEGKDQNNKAWKLDDRAGKKNVLLYFYPKDNTPGCTKEACGLRDRIETLKKEDVEVVGVSFDNGESHQKFIADQHLNFTLLQDTDGKIADAFNARSPGKNTARRVSFLIGKDGKIKHITDTPKADVHLEEMKDAVAKLGAK
ncbi:MAG: peroxiredoxin [Verrucomicrobiales bacterium]|nr:peroxiredoxin [Verrucomicrobiales bacterium]